MADDICKETVIRWKVNGEDVVKNFQYKLPFGWYFFYRHAVDDNNNLSHALSSIEDKFITDRWECQLFAFIFSISEVNAFLILRYFVYYGLRWGGMPALLEFCRKLAWKIMNNIYIGGNQGGGGGFFPDSIHLLMAAPRHVRRYQNPRWICTGKTVYQRYSCSFKCGKA